MRELAHHHCQTRENSTGKIWAALIFSEIVRESIKGGRGSRPNERNPWDIRGIWGTKKSFIRGGSVPRSKPNYLAVVNPCPSPGKSLYVQFLTEKITFI